MSNDSVLVIGRDFGVETRGFLDETLRIEKVVAETLRSQLSATTGILRDVLQGFDVQSPLYTLGEVTVRLEVSASGQVAILGNGVGASGKGGIELKFLRKDRAT